MKGTWKVYWDPGDPNYDHNLKIAREIAKELDISEFLSKLLVSRGITNHEDARKYLYPDEASVTDPFLMKDMEKAIDLLLQIKEKEEDILIFGDYDVDGVTAAAVLYLSMLEMGFKVDAYIPSRMDEGYSLNIEAIEEFKAKKCKNILTVDCGITSIVEISRAKELGLNVIVTDHHEPQDLLPPADAIVNPKRKDDNYPFKGLAGVGVAFKLLTALVKKLDNGYDPYKFIDLVAVGTIADIVPLLSENRYFVKLGINKLKTSPSPGLEYLLKELKIVPDEITSQVIAYKVAPKINAAGRMADAFTAFKLLISRKPEELTKYVEMLIKHNTKRQSKERDIYNFAMSLIDINPDLKKDKVIVLSGENWHIGVLGIVSSKLSSQFNKPVLLISKDGDFGKGSARSPQGVSLMDLFKTASKDDIFSEFGGHELAAGFTIMSKDIDKLRKSINDAYESLYGDQTPVATIAIDMEIENVWNTFFEDIKRLEPFGYKNSEPLFLLTKVRGDNFKFFGNNLLENFAVKIKTEKEMMIDAIGYGLTTNLSDIKNSNNPIANMSVVGNFRIERTYDLKSSFIKLYLKDIEIKAHDFTKLDSYPIQSNGLLKDEIMKIEKLDVIVNNLGSEKVAMFLQSRLKYSVMLKKIIDSLNSNKKILLISSSNILLQHTFDIISAYLPSTNLYYNKRSKISSKMLMHQKIFFFTVPAFMSNISLFDLDKFEIIIDEPYYMVSHQATEGVKEYLEFSKFIVNKEKDILILGSIYSEAIKELFRKAGYKILVSNSSNANYEIIKETKSLLEILKDYSKDTNKKVVVINEHKKQEILLEAISQNFDQLEDNIKIYNKNMEFSKKIIAKESVRKGNYNFLITSYSNNGLAMDNMDSQSTFILLDVPRTNIEMIDLIASWSSNKKSICIVLGYDSKFKTRLLYEYERNYPSFNVLKQTYEYIKNNASIKESEIITNFFKGDLEFGKTVLDELLDVGIILNVSNKIEAIEELDESLIKESVKAKESILDYWLIKNSINTFENLDTKKFLEIFKTVIS